MADKNINLPHHGRETYAVYYGDRFVLKRPLPTFNDAAKNAWLKKQHETKQKIDDIRRVGNPVYNIPEMVFINDEEYQILEERALGEPLTRQLYDSLSKRQQFEIINSLGSFLVDMNELKPIGKLEPYKISNDIKFSRLDSFVETKMSKWFTKSEVLQLAKVRDEIGSFEYETRLAWSHGDINAGNVLYDANTNKLSFIDFAETGYRYIYRDIFAPLQVELDIYKRVYETYYQLHNKELYIMPHMKNESLREIMKYRITAVVLRRIIKAADDLRINPTSPKSETNNIEKIFFIRRQIQKFELIDKMFTK